jgi:hypothetical protein
MVYVPRSVFLYLDVRALSAAMQAVQGRQVYLMTGITKGVCAVK